MSTRASTVFTDRPFSITPLGIAVLVSAGVLFGLGVHRFELASLLWGGTFAALAVFGVVIAGAQRALLVRAVNRGLLSIEAALEPRRLSVGEETRLSVEGFAGVPQVPGVRLSYACRLRWRDMREVVLSYPFSRRRGNRPTVCPERGYYTADGARFVCEDALGLFRFTAGAPSPGSLVVAPAPRERPAVASFSRRHGERPQRSDRRIRTEELLEVRRYVPGDDVRRINWKQYARWEELFLRIGEEIPPAAQEVVLLLWASMPPVSRAFGLAILDRAVSLFADLAVSFKRQGMSVFYHTDEPGRPHRALEDPADSDFAAALADASFALGGNPPLGADSGRCVVVAVPDGNLNRRLTELRTHGVGATLFLVEPPEPIAAERGWKSWMLLPRADTRRWWVSHDTRRYLEILEHAIVGLDGKVSEVHRA